MLLFYGNLDSLYYGSLAFCRDLLRTLERDKGQLKVMGCLLKGVPLPGLMAKAWSGMIATRM